MKFKLFESPECISNDLTLLEAFLGPCIWRREFVFDSNLNRQKAIFTAQR